MDELLWAGADTQADALRDGRVTAPALLDAVLRRADLLNPTLNIFRTLYPSVRADAEAAQRRLDAGERTPLLGVPVAVKDDIDVAGDVTGAGGRAQFPPAERDSAVVAALRAAGAVLIGRTHVPDRCLWSFTETLTHGATRNPWHLDHTPGGSSGGSAAAVAAGIVGLATGSDGGGSIRIPAGACGVFGLKTTRGLISLAPVTEVWHGLSGAGALGRTVADAGAMLDVVADNGSGYRAAVDADPGRLRIALAWRTPLGRPPMDPERRAAVLATAERLRALGHQVVEADPPLGARPTGQFAVRYLRGVADSVAALPHPEWLESRTRAIAALGRRVPDSVLRKARAAESTMDDLMREFFTAHDVILQPSWAKRPSRIGQFHGRGMTATVLGLSRAIPYFPTWNVLGYPVAAMPVGHDRAGLPMGVQLVGPAHGERLLLSLAGSYERAHPWNHLRPPSWT